MMLLIRHFYRVVQFWSQVRTSPKIHGASPLPLKHTQHCCHVHLAAFSPARIETLFWLLLFLFLSYLPVTPKKMHSERNVINIQMHYRAILYSSSRSGRNVVDGAKIQKSSPIFTAHASKYRAWEYCKPYDCKSQLCCCAGAALPILLC